MNRLQHATQLTPRQRTILVGLPLGVGLVMPSLIHFGVRLLVVGASLLDAIGDVLNSQLHEGGLMLTLIGMIPFGIQSAMMSGCASHCSRRMCVAMLICGLVGIFALMIPVHVDYWRQLHGPGRMSSTAGIVFIFIPFYCTAALLVSQIIGWLITRPRWFRAFPTGHCRNCGYDLTGNESDVCPECANTVSIT